MKEQDLRDNVLPDNTTVHWYASEVARLRQEREELKLDIEYYREEYQHLLERLTEDGGNDPYGR